MRSALLASSLALVACGGGSASSPKKTFAGNGGSDSTAGAAGEPSASAGSGGDTAQAGTGGGGTSEGGEAGAVNEAGAGGAAPTVSGIHIEGGTATVSVTLGQPSLPVLLHAVGVLTDSTSEPVTAPVWTSDNPSIATVTPDGVLVATGALGGKVTVHAIAGGVDGTVTFTVELVSRVFEGTLTTGDQAAVEAGIASAGGPVWQYPEDQTLFPSRMTPPTFQWEKGADAAFQLSFTRGSEVEIDVYTSNNEYQPSAAVWAALGSDFTAAVSVKLAAKASLSAATPRRASVAHSFRTANADLSGAMYYFSASGSAFSRLSLPSASTATSLFPSNDNTCRSCHSVSRDGSLVAFQYDGPQTNPSGVLRTSDSNTLIAVGDESQWSFSAFNPNGALLVGERNGTLTLFDMTKPSAPPALPVTVAASNATMPAWSPDGSTLAFVQFATDGTDYSFANSAVYTTIFSQQPAFAAPKLLTAGESVANRGSLAFPSWSPDSRYLAIGVGSNDYTPTAMTVELVDVATKARVALTSAMPSGINETPTFAPRAQGGYYFLAFTSNRAYGHKSTARQVWVTAIDGNIQAGIDPSHAAFWLPAQDVTAPNVLPEWSQDACSGRTATCTTDAQCCGGLSCLTVGQGKQCLPNACSVMGEPCVKAADCCAGAVLTCAASRAGALVCQPAAP